MQKVTAAIPTIGREETLPSVLTALAFQTHPIDELILLDESKKPMLESYVINQALDLLSVQGTDVKILRNRRKKGIGDARLKVAREARNDLVVEIDDDVVLRPNCLEEMVIALNEWDAQWAVPVCFLIPASFVLDGYNDKKVSFDDADVQKWIHKYPWFLPYFRYIEQFTSELLCSGTQAILLRRGNFLKTCSKMKDMGTLPREDTYMTMKMGKGAFTSVGECLHFEHVSQEGRDNWGTSMFYRIHEVITENPDQFLSLFKR